MLDRQQEQVLTKMYKLVGATLAALALSSPATESQSETAKLEARLRELDPSIVVKNVVASPVAGLNEVELDGGQYVYATADGRYVFAGNLLEFGDDGWVPITEGRRNDARRELMASLLEKDMIVFTPKDTRASVTVFTDTDCGYCRQLHTSMSGYHALGIEVRYIAYPRAGVGSETYQRMVSAWCAEDPRDALTALKNGEEIAKRSCINPVAEQYELGQEMGISGTPSLVLADGRLLPGFAPPAQLADILGLASADASR